MNITSSSLGMRCGTHMKPINLYTPRLRPGEFCDIIIAMDSQIKALLDGQIVILPTETVEGYAVRLADMDAIEQLMELKERNYDSGKVFTLVPESPEQIEKFVLVSDYARSVIDKYIPGELTIILPKNPDFHHPYYDHFDTIGIRIPKHPSFPEILPYTGPLILTSANPRGGTPKSTTGHLPSTILDATTDTPKILRQGNLHLDI